MVCARVIRGKRSIANAVTPVASEIRQVFVRREQADEDAAAAELRQLRWLGPRHLEHDVGLTVDIGRASERRAGGDEFRVRNAGAGAGAALNQDGMAATGGELFHRLGRGRHTCLARTGFCRDANAHRVEPLGSRLESTAHGALTDFI